MAENYWNEVSVNEGALNEAFFDNAQRYFELLKPLEPQDQSDKLFNKFVPNFYNETNLSTYQSYLERTISNYDEAIDMLLHYQRAEKRLKGLLASYVVLPQTSREKYSRQYTYLRKFKSGKARIAEVNRLKKIVRAKTEECQVLKNLEQKPKYKQKILELRQADKYFVPIRRTFIAFVKANKDNEFVKAEKLFEKTLDKNTIISACKNLLENKDIQKQCGKQF